MSITVNSVPEDWDKYSDEKDKSTYTRPTHTQKVPRMVVFSRKAPVRNGSDLGVATATFKIVNGDTVDSLPALRNTVCEVTLRDPQVNASSVMDDVIDVLQALAAHSTIVPDLQKGLLPQAEQL